MKKITADVETLMQQAPDTVMNFHARIVELIDARLGKGYAAANPELVNACILSCAIEYAATIVIAALQDLAGKPD